MTLRATHHALTTVVLVFALALGACAPKPTTSTAKLTRSERIVAQELLKNLWPPGSPMACLLAQLQQGLSYHQAVEACKISSTGPGGVGVPAPTDLGAFPVLVRTGSKTPTTAACVSVPTRGGFGTPGEDASVDAGDKKSEKDLEKERQDLLDTAAELLRQLDQARDDKVREGLAASYQKVMVEVFKIDRQLNRDYDKPMPKYPYKHTVQGAESPCQQVNGFIAQCDDSRWMSSECRAVRDYINGCANREVSRVEGDADCKPMAPESSEVAAILEAQCSKLARGADGQNPCDRKPPEGASATQIVVERCKLPEDAVVTPGGGAIPGQESCTRGDLEKFLQMALPARDFSSITAKIGGPQPPTGGDPGTGDPPR